MNKIFSSILLAAVVLSIGLAAVPKAAQATNVKTGCLLTFIGSKSEYRCGTSLGAGMHIMLAERATYWWGWPIAGGFRTCHADVNSVVNNTANVAIAHDLSDCPWKVGTTFTIFWYTN